MGGAEDALYTIVFAQHRPWLLEFGEDGRQPKRGNNLRVKFTCFGIYHAGGSGVGFGRRCFEIDRCILSGRGGCRPRTLPSIRCRPSWCRTEPAYPVVSKSNENPARCRFCGIGLDRNWFKLGPCTGCNTIRGMRIADNTIYVVIVQLVGNTEC